MLEQKILLAQMDPETVSDEIGDFVIQQVKEGDYIGCVIGLSGGIDSTTTATLIKRAFDRHNLRRKRNKLEIVGYIMPSDINNPEDARDGIRVAENLGVRYEVLDINGVVEAYRTTNPEAFDVEYHKGNLMSRIRGNILSTKAATERKLVAGTGNWDEDFGLGYYTLFGDGAVHMSPIGNLPKRLVREMAKYLGIDSYFVNREPTAGLEPGQTDFKDLGYSYDTAELIIRGLELGIDPRDLADYSQVKKQIEPEISYKGAKFTSAYEIIEDIMQRHIVAEAKAGIVSPPAAPVSLYYGKEIWRTIKKVERE
ncbi:TPA: NAD(+) synthase [Candidatus Woesearchaeota archaeon]|nr:NAD(+) synthase [Candidatus Woesearchaeota archaeon]HIH41868.1 NAD(+) synthase [Candidatus Woesearchaeota archaeon]